MFFTLNVLGMSSPLDMVASALKVLVWIFFSGSKILLAAAVDCLHSCMYLAQSEFQMRWMYLACRISLELCAIQVLPLNRRACPSRDVCRRCFRKNEFGYLPDSPIGPDSRPVVVLACRQTFLTTSCYFAV